MLEMWTDYGVWKYDEHVLFVPRFWSATQIVSDDVAEVSFSLYDLFLEKVRIEIGPICF